MEIVIALICGICVVGVCHIVVNRPQQQAPWAWGSINDNAWKVDQQMIVTEPKGSGSSKELIKADAFIPLDWPRVIQVTIKNGHMNQLVGEVPVHESQEPILAKLLIQAGERAAWLNAHQVR